MNSVYYPYIECPVLEIFFDKDLTNPHGSSSEHGTIVIVEKSSEIILYSGEQSSSTYNDIVDKIYDVWEREFDSDGYTILLMNDGTFYQFCNNTFKDPNYWYGTYSIVEDTLKMNINGDFSGTTTMKEYKIEITESNVELTDSENTLTYLRVKQ